jgi:amino acid adenylation domain-containing protein
MLNKGGLHRFLDEAAQNRPEHVAVVEPRQASIRYDDLGVLSDRVRDWLILHGVRPGDRVGVYLRKSIDSVATIFGILKAGAAYVPVDPSAPVARNAYIFNDCSVRAAVVETRFADKLHAELRLLGGSIQDLLLLEGVGGGACLSAALAREKNVTPVAKTIDSSLDDLAYILYTSGSTGKPKGVMLSHLNAISFIEWCSEVFQPHGDDRFSSHAPFHFDLSILDIYLPIRHGATLVLIGEELGKDPVKLAPVIAEEKISIWYSTPSVLTLLTEYGKLEQYDYGSLRMIHFAGEVFPIKYLRRLKTLVPAPRYFNLYGPTETNVCTYFELPADIPAEQSKPFPIGKSCSHIETKVVNENCEWVAAGQEGELCVTGAGVMLGYWNLPQRTARAFIEDASGQRWYETGDIVVEEPDGNYSIIGRRDRMVKKRGYRVELGEIETAFYRHPSVEHAAVVALSGDDGVRVKAFLCCRDGNRPSIIELKRFCSENLPSYMVPDLFAFLERIPTTSTGKTDYQNLQGIA